MIEEKEEGEEEITHKKKMKEKRGEKDTVIWI